MQEEIPIQEQPKGAFWKLQALVFEPGSAFREIARNPTWLIPVLLAIVLAIAGLLIPNWVLGADEVMMMRIEASGQEIPEEQLDRIREFSSISTISTLVFIAVFTPVLLLIQSGVCMLAFMLMGVESQFRKFFSVIVHSAVVLLLIRVMLTALVYLVSGDPRELDVNNPVASNLGFLFEQRESPVMYTLAASLDVTVIYYLVLVGMGLAITANRKTLGPGMAVSFGSYAFWVLLAMGLAAMFT